VSESRETSNVRAEEISRIVADLDMAQVAASGAKRCEEEANTAGVWHGRFRDIALMLSRHLASSGMNGKFICPGSSMFSD
jgi:hypothetical protein